MRTPAPLRRLALAWLVTCVSSMTACFGEGDAPVKPGERAQPRKDDPELTHSWKLPVDQSVLESADLGSTPPALADALMANGAAPGITHRIAGACAQRSALADTATVALRLTIAEDGSVGALEGDPAGAASSCLADAFRAEIAKLDPLPAGAALMVLRFHATARAQ